MIKKSLASILGTYDSWFDLGVILIRVLGNKTEFKEDKIEILSSVICPIHSVCVPLQWGVIEYVSKLHGPPFLVSPINLPSS